MPFESLHFHLPEKLGQGDAVVAGKALDGAEREVAAAGFEQADVQARGAGDDFLEDAALFAQGREFRGDAANGFRVMAFGFHNVASFSDSDSSATRGASS